MNRKILVISILIAALIAFGGAAWYVSQPVPTTDVAAADSEVTEALVRGHSPILGPEEAPVTIVEFFDPACEACRAFYPVVEDILTDYPDDVRVVLRYAAFHGEASEQAIKVLEAARMQDVFVPVLEAVLEAQPEWATHGSAPQASILEIAGGAGLDVEAASSQIMSTSTDGLMNQDRTDIETIGVSQTPTFFVNGRPLTEFGAEQLRALVDEEVARVGDS